jgi:F-type H+-transporting ATPase subunit delta
MRNAAIARVYASALLELATEKGELAQVSSDLSDLSAMLLEGEALSSLLESPELGLEQKRQALQKITEGAASGLTLNFLLLLLRKHRESLLGSIILMFDRLLDELEGRVRGKLHSARPLSEDEKQRLEATLSRSTGSRVLLDTETDEDLLAGMVLQLADKTLDGSLRSRLASLRDRLETAEMGKE